MLKWLIVVVVLYGGFVALLYVAQRSLQYFPERRRTTPRVVGLPEAEEAVLDTADGERVIVWHAPPRAGRPVFLYFHGNGGSLRWRAERFRALITDGSGLVALSYRGYGGSSGRPTETGLVEDAAAAYAFAIARYPAEHIVLWGESLGSALALAVAAEKPVGHLVLEAPFTSAADVGAQHYWFVPVRLLHLQKRVRLSSGILLLRERERRVTQRVLCTEGFVKRGAETNYDFDTHALISAVGGLPLASSR